MYFLQFLSECDIPFLPLSNIQVFLGAYLQGLSGRRENADGKGGMLMSQLWSALSICPGEVVAFTGGGGKSSLALMVAQELSRAGRSVIFTTTTKIYPVPGMRLVFGLDGVRDALAGGGGPVCVVACEEPGTGKLVGISPEAVASLQAAAPGAVILVEADGSAGRPLKLPAPHEPVIPPCASLVVPVAGASALGKPISAEWLHRVSLFPAAGLVTPTVVADALLACTRGTPPGARIVPVLGQADLPGAEPGLRETASLLLGRGGVGRVVLAAPATAQPVRAVIGDVAAVVLAGGASRRFGGNKLAAAVGELSLLESSLRAPLRAGLAHVIVVTGAYHDALAPMLARWPVQVVQNPDWETGMSTTLRAGLAALDASINAAVLCLADQPYLPPSVVTGLVEAWRRGRAPIVAPVAGGARRNPVLFDRRLFPELMAVSGDEGGRSVVRRHEAMMEAVPCAETAWFRDIDSQQDIRC